MATMTKSPELELPGCISEIPRRASVRAGSSLHLRTQETVGGDNFAVFSSYASRVQLELFNHPVVRGHILAEIHWFGPQGGSPNWPDPKEKNLACVIQENGQGALFLMFNAGTNGTDFGMPPLPQGFCWHLAVDTSRLAPQDLLARGEQMLDDSEAYHLEARSSAILLARKQESVS
jgi:hypothetical protein